MTKPTFFSLTSNNILAKLKIILEKIRIIRIHWKITMYESILVEL